MADSYVISGSRNWPSEYRWFITQKMIELIPRGSLVITGGALGVDQWAYLEARRLGCETLVIPANWRRYGKSAGFIRNIEMLEHESNPKALIAFHWQRSRGTAHAIREAYKRDIGIHRFTEADIRPNLAILDMGDTE